MKESKVIGTTGIAVACLGTWGIVAVFDKVPKENAPIFAPDTVSSGTLANGNAAEEIGNLLESLESSRMLHMHSDAKQTAADIQLHDYEKDASKKDDNNKTAEGYRSLVRKRERALDELNRKYLDLEAEVKEYRERIFAYKSVSEALAIARNEIIELKTSVLKKDKKLAARNISIKRLRQQIAQVDSRGWVAKPIVPEIPGTYCCSEACASISMD